MKVTERERISNDSIKKIRREIANYKASGTFALHGREVLARAGVKLDFLDRGVASAETTIREEVRAILWETECNRRFEVIFAQYQESGKPFHIADFLHSGDLPDKWLRKSMKGERIALYRRVLDLQKINGKAAPASRFTSEDFTPEQLPQLPRQLTSEQIKRNREKAAAFRNNYFEFRGSRALNPEPGSEDALLMLKPFLRFNHRLRVFGTHEQQRVFSTALYRVVWRDLQGRKQLQARS